MKKLTFILLLIFFALSNYAIEIPTGGINMIDDAITNHTKIGSAGTITVVNAEHSEFSKALRINVTSLPANYYNFQVQFKTNMALEKDDVCLVSFWARTTKSGSEAGEGTIAAVIEHNKTYEKPLNRSFSPGGEWKHFVYAFKANMSLSTETHKAAFFVGFAVQTIEVAKVQFLNYKNTIILEELPTMPITYAGMAADAPWRMVAAEKIEKFRKGNVSVKLVDSNNNPISDASVSLEMKKHKFGFGSAIDANYYNTNSTYKNHIHELFNEIVFENDLKWRPWPSKSSHNYVLQAIESLESRNIKSRGHCLVWPRWDHLPTTLKLYENNPERLKLECLEHIEEAVTLTKGKVVDWDVINEAYTNHDLMDICGEEIMVDWFKKAKEVDPDLKRYINDYSILGNGGGDINHQNAYFDLIKYIDEKGGEIDGIGMQSHFAEHVTGIPKLLEILDRFATFNKEIKVTEFDINSANDSLKVNYTRDFMTLLFSHPYVKSIMCWGFWEGRHWRPQSAYFNKDWSIRPQGEMYKNLVFEKWWTEYQSINSKADGFAEFGSCFLGTYDVVVKFNDKIIVKSVPIHFNQENNIIINIDNETFSIEGAEQAETPLFTSAKSIKESNIMELDVYPNPASTHLNLNLRGVKNNNCLVQVLDISGKSLLNKQMNLVWDNQLQLSGLKPGMYFISVQAKNQRFVEKFIIK